MTEGAPLPLLLLSLLFSILARKIPSVSERGARGTSSARRTRVGGAGVTAATSTTTGVVGDTDSVAVGAAGLAAFGTALASCEEGWGTWALSAATSRGLKSSLVEVILND